MRAVPSPSGSNLPTLFRWCLGGMAAFPSGSGSASARDADADARALKLLEKMEADCGQISAKQQEILARAPFIGGDDGGEDEDEEEAEVFSTPPLTQQDPQRQGQSQRGQPGEVCITMCSMPFTQTPPASPSSSASSSSSDSRPRKTLKRVCTRKVRAGTKIRPPTPTPTPTPTPAAPAPTPAATPAPTPAATPPPAPAPSPSPELDPLARIVFMIPTAPLPTTGQKDILELARSLGIF